MSYNEICLFGSGTGRSGGWLVTNIMCVHSKIMVFTERVHFFRFIYGQYDHLSPKNVERMLHHLRLRIGLRFSVAFEVEPVLNSIINRGEITYTTCYQEIMKWLLATTDKSIWGEYAPMSWRSIPQFLDMFQNGNVFHVYRDLRGVLASWDKMSFMPDNLYLNQIFNWIDSINHILRFKETLPRERYLPIKFEDIHAHPEKTVHGICNFLEVPFEEQLLCPERWPDLFDQRYVIPNVSSHDKKRRYGFHTKLTDNWHKSLQPLQVTLSEFLARDQLGSMGYECSNHYDASDLHYGIKLLTQQPFLLENFQRLLSSGEGTQILPNDPTDPKNWSAGENYCEKFVDTPIFQEYISELDKVESYIDKKYDCK